MIQLLILLNLSVSNTIKAPPPLKAEFRNTVMHTRQKGCLFDILP